MPLPETLTLDPQVVAQARRDHLLRTQQRLSQFQQKLKTGATGAERSLIETEIVKLEAQVEQARNPHPVEASAGQPVGLGLVQMVQTLTAELASLKATLTKTAPSEKAA